MELFHFLENWLFGSRRRRPNSHPWFHGWYLVRLEYVNEYGDTMATYDLTIGNTASIPLVFKDTDGNVIGVPSGLLVASSNEAAGTVVVGPDGASVVLTPVGSGTFTVTASVGDVSATLDVTVAEVIGTGTLASIEFDVDHAVVTPIGSASAV